MNANTLFSIFLFLFLINVKAQENKLNYFENETSYIQTYGLENETTINLIKLLLNDSANIVICDEHIFWINSIMSDHFDVEKDNPICVNQIDDLKNHLFVKQLASFNFDDKLEFPDLYFSIADSNKYKKITDEYTNGEKIITVLAQLDSMSKIQLCNKFVKDYNLSKLDSMIILKRAFGRKIEDVDLIQLGNNKRVIYILHDYILKDNLDKFKTKAINPENVFFIIGRRDSKKDEWGMRNNYRFEKNRIKYLKKREDFSLIDYKDLPSKISLNRSIKCDIQKIKSSKFIYVKQLYNCRGR